MRPMRHQRLRPAGHALLAVLALAASGCTQVPELDQTISDSLRDARYPALIPLDDDIFAGQDPGAEAEDIETDLAGRRDRLKSRAAGMTAPVIDPETRKRMQAGVAR